MLSRAQLFGRTLRLRAQRQLARAANENTRADALTLEILAIDGDLLRLREVPEAADMLEELYLRFMARCRLLELGPYLVSGFVGAGQRGVVFRAQHREQGNGAVAIKVLFLPRNKEELTRFDQEAHILFGLRHPAIVQGLCAAQGEEFLPVRWYAMELIQPAKPFGQFRNEVDLATVLLVLADTCDGLHHAHSKGVVHRDLHLDNILVLQERLPKILDFGAARYRADNVTFRPVGGLYCCSPEKLDSPESADGQSDVFSIGCMLYFHLSDRWPFHGAFYGEFIRNLHACNPEPVEHDSTELCRWIHASLARNPDERPSAAELAHALRSVAEEI